LAVDLIYTEIGGWQLVSISDDVYFTMINVFI